MEFGVCANFESASDAARSGFEYLEPGASSTLRGDEASADVLPVLRSVLQSAALPVQAFNLFLPGDLKIVGPVVDWPRAASYVRETFDRAAVCGARVIVFGSGGARNIPAGWARDDARRQMNDFLLLCKPEAERTEIDLAIEALNVGECNFVNSVAEAAEFARGCGSPRVGVVSDLYHIITDGQSMEETFEARDVLKHVHVAGAADRRTPRWEDLDLLTEYFRVLKRAEYDAMVSVEAVWENIGAQGEETHAVLTQAWADA